MGKKIKKQERTDRIMHLKGLTIWRVKCTEHQKAPQELDIPDLPTNLKNDVSYPSGKPHSSVASFVYKSSCL